MIDITNIDYTSEHHLFLMALGVFCGYLLKAFTASSRCDKQVSSEKNTCKQKIQEYETKLKRQESELQKQKDKVIELLEKQIHLGQEKHLESQKRKERYGVNDISNPDNQLKFIEGGNYYRQRPITEEATDHVFTPLMHKIKERADGQYVLLAEVVLGAFIKTKSDTFESEWHSDKAFASYRAKRPDFLIIDNYGVAILAIEYDGTGHKNNEKAEKEREVKAQVLEQVGIPLIICRSSDLI